MAHGLRPKRVPDPILKCCLEPPITQAAVALALDGQGVSYTETACVGLQRLPLAQLCVLQSIWPSDATVLPPLLHVETWSACMSIGRIVFQGPLC